MKHVYAVHLGVGGEIGPHRAGFGQLFVVIEGDGSSPAPMAFGIAFVVV